jgi:putative peptidoglycan lipid II flippase
VRLAAGVAIALPLAFVVPARLGLDPRWGAAGLTLAGGIAGWLELFLLRRALERRIGRTRVAPALLARLWAAAIAAAAVALAVERAIGAAHPVVFAAVVLGSYGAVYVSAARALDVAEARALLDRAVALLRRT